MNHESVVSSLVREVNEMCRMVLYYYAKNECQLELLNTPEMRKAGKVNVKMEM